MIGVVPLCGAKIREYAQLLARYFAAHQSVRKIACRADHGTDVTTPPLRRRRVE